MMGLEVMTLTTLEEMHSTVYDVLIIGAGVGGRACLHRFCERWKNEKRKIGILDQQEVSLELSMTFCERPHSFETEGWGIPYSELEPYFLLAEKYLHKSYITTKESSLQKSLLDRLHLNGIIEAVPAKLAQRQMGDNHPMKMSNLRVDVALGGKALYLESGAGTVMVQVALQEKRVELQGKEVVLATGPMESPCILHRSGYKSPALGCYLSGNPSIQATGFLDEEHRGEEAFAIVKPVTKWEPMVVQITKHPVSPLIHFNGQGKIVSREENRVLPGTREESQSKYQYSESDYKGIHHTLESVVSYAYLMGISLQDASLKLIEPHQEQYKGCSCRMGKDSQTSVTDLHGQVHGTSHLFLADASVLPTLPACGPIVPTIALAMRLADYLVDITL